MADRDGYVKIIVNGEEHEIDIYDELPIDNIDSDMKNIPAEIAFWGTILAGAEEERVLTDSFYRKWRAETAEELLGNEPKLAEWKVKQRLEAMDQFQVLKKAIAKTVKHSTVAKTMFEAYCRKANMLQSKGAMLRQQLSSDDMSVKVDNEERVEKMRSSFKKKKRSKKNG